MSSARKKLLVASALFLGLLLVSKTTNAGTLTVDPSGKVIVETRGQVLSKGSDDSGSSESSGSSDSSGSSGSSSTSGSGSSEQRTTTTTTGGATIETKQKEGEIRTETTLPSGTKIKTREQPDRTRTDVFEGGAKLRLERREDRTIIKLEDEKGEETELPEGTENEIFKIQERADKGQIRVSTLKDRFVFSRENIGATTTFPLSVNLKTNELTVTTPAGEKVITVLPDQAIKNMLALNVIDQVKGIPFTQDVEKSATQAGTALEEVINKFVSTEIKLTTTREGVLAYEIPGTKRTRFLGFINVEIQKTAVVSAETGGLLGTQESLISKVLDLLSF